MKTLMSITTNQYDRDQYKDREELNSFFSRLGFDGLEVLLLDDTAMDDLLTPESVTGIHLPFVNCWMDFWLQNTDRLLEEYRSTDVINRYFGGGKKENYTARMEKAIRYSNRFHPDYLVYHVSECTAYEAVSNRYYYSDEAVIDACADFINSWAESIEGSPLLLLENLWHSGLNLKNPNQVSRLLSKIHYPNTGIMLDVGHLMHCDPTVQTSAEGVDYILRILSTFPDLSVFRGIHLHETLSSEAILAHRKAKDLKDDPYSDKLTYYFPLVFEIDAHRPFTSPRIREVIDLVDPDYLLFELSASTKEEYADLAMIQHGILS